MKTDQSAARITPLTMDDVKRGDYVTYGTPRGRVMVIDRIEKDTVGLEDPFHPKGQYSIEVSLNDSPSKIARASNDHVESEFQRVGVKLPPYFGRSGAEQMKAMAVEDRKYLIAQIKKGLSGLDCAMRTTAAIRRNLGKWFSELADTHGGELKKAVAEFTKNNGTSDTPSYTTVHSWVKFYRDYKDVPEGELPVTRDSARSANPAWTQTRKETAPPTRAVVEKKVSPPNKKNTTEVHDAVDAPVIADTLVVVAEDEPHCVKDGLVGLQAVIVALESLGLYAEYQEALNRIRVALEAEQKNRQMDGLTA